MSTVEPWFIRLLGRLEMQQGARPAKTLRNGRDACLLAYLAFHRETEHSRERLAELLWPDNTEAGALLRGSLMRLRAHLEPPGTAGGSVLLAGRTRIALNREVVNTDVAEFKRLWQAASAAPPVRRYSLLSEAVALYRGELLPLQTEDWLVGVREELAHRYYVMLGQLSQLAEESGQRDQAIAFALAAISASSDDEAAYVALMRLYGADGRSREAMNLFRKLIRRRAGAPVSEQIRLLARQLQRNPESLQKPAERRIEIPTSDVGDVVSLADSKPSKIKRSLPQPVTRFFGRDKELESLIQMLTSESPRRLVTLLGMGGLGKSRLTLEVAQRFPGPVFYAELAAPAGKDELLAALLSAVDPRGEYQQEDPLERLAAAISKASTDSKVSSGRVLLILDNAELTTTEAARQVITPLLTKLANLVCLVASRRALLPDMEQQFPLLPLPLPEPTEDITTIQGFTSVQLFVDRAQARKLDFRLTRGNAPIIAQLMAGLDGIPLAIELAAARAGSLTPTQMREQLSRPSELLVDLRQERPERHRSLTAALEGTCALLEPELIHFFRGLSVFQGGFTAEAADAIVGPIDLRQTLLLIERLREASLIVEFPTSQEESVMRFSLLESVRTYAFELLYESGEEEILRRRHRSYFEALLEQAYQPLLHSDPSVRSYWLKVIQLDLDNIRAALRWCQQDPEGARHGLNMAGVLRHYFEATGLYQEGRQHLAHALTHPCVLEELRSAEYQKALNHAGILASYMGDWKEAQHLCHKTLRLRRATKSRYREAVALHNLGQIAQRLGKLRSARILYESSLAIELELAGSEGENQVRAQQGLADSHHNLGRLALIDRRYKDARAHFEQCLPEYQRTKNRFREGLTMSNMGLLYLHTGQPIEAEKTWDRVLDMGAELQEKRLLAAALSGLGQVRREQGDLSSSAAFLKASLENESALGNQTGIAESLGEIAALLMVIGTAEALDRATRLLGAEESLRVSIHSPRYAPDLAEREKRLAVLRSALGEAGFRVAWAMGQAMSRDDAIQLALRV